MNYSELTEESYVELLVDLISDAEGPHPSAVDIGDGKATIGYGYTLNRDNNVAIWDAAGVTLTTLQRSQLAAIDGAAAEDKTALALQFDRTVSKEESKKILEQTYPEYEQPAIGLACRSHQREPHLFP